MPDRQIFQRQRTILHDRLELQKAAAQPTPAGRPGCSDTCHARASAPPFGHADLFYIHVIGIEVNKDIHHYQCVPSTQPTVGPYLTRCVT